MWSLTRASLVFVTLLAGLLIMLIGTAWLQHSYYQPSANDVTECRKRDPLTWATVTVNATITSAGVTYPRLESAVEIVVPMKSPASAVLFTDVDSKEYRAAMGCLLGRPYWQEDPDRRAAMPAISTGDGQLKIRYVSSGDLVPLPSSLPTSIGYFNFYYDDQDAWTLDLAYPHFLMGAKWSVTINAPPEWLNSPEPAPTTVPDNARMQWSLNPTGDALETLDEGRCLDPATCLRVKLEVPAQYQLLANGSWYPGGLLASFLMWAPWFAVLIWAYVLAGAHIAGRRRPGGGPISIRRILLPVLLISIAGFLIIAIGFRDTSDETYAEFLGIILAEGMGLTVLAIVSALCWGLSPLPTLLVGLLALVMAGGTASGFDSFDDDAQRVATLLASGYGLLFTVLAVAGFLSALCLLIGRREPTRHPEYLCWIAGTAIALGLLAERDGTKAMDAADGYWLSPSHPTYSELLYSLITFPTDLSSAVFGVFGALVVAALLRALFDTAAWDENIGHPLVRARLLTLGAAVFFVGVEWDATLWTWPLSLWVIVLPITVLTFLRFRSILDAPVRSGRTLRSVVIEYGLENLREDGKRWRASVREGRSIDKRLGQGDIEIAEHRAELGRIREEADRSRNLILAHTWTTCSSTSPRSICCSPWGPTPRGRRTPATRPRSLRCGACRSWSGSPAGAGTVASRPGFWTAAPSCFPSPPMRSG